MLNNMKLFYLCNENQQNPHFYVNVFNLIIVSSRYFENPSVHPQEDLYMQFYCISFMYIYILLFIISIQPLG